jgi:hypothetical protein
MRAHHVVLALAALTVARTATAQYFEARNHAMGGTGVASSHYLAAGWANPALLTRFGETDDFGILLPAVGAFVHDRTALIDDLTAFTDEFDRVDAAVQNNTATQQDLDNLADDLAGLSNRELYGTVGGGFALAVPSRSLGWAIHLNIYADMTAVAQIDPADVAAIRNALNDPTLPTMQSEARVLGVAVADLGVSLATRFGSDDLGVSVGVTPKYQSVESFNYAARVDQFEDGDFTEDQYRADDSGFNVDLGAALEVGKSLTFGLMARNLIAQSYDTIAVLGQTATYEVNPEFAVGAAWNYGMLTLAVDADLTSRERFADDVGVLQQIGLVDDVQFVRFGGELNVLDWLQLRGGYVTDLESYVDDTITAGLGISPFGVFRIEVAGSYVDQDSYGGVVQMSLTF